MFNCGCEYISCGCDNVTVLPPIISSCFNCCKPLKRPKVVFEPDLIGDEMTAIICVANCGVDIKAPFLRENECIEFEEVLNPCDGMDIFRQLYVCCGNCTLALECPEDTVHLPGACEEGICIYYRIKYVGESTTLTYQTPPTTQSAKNQDECECCE